MQHKKKVQKFSITNRVNSNFMNSFLYHSIGNLFYSKSLNLGNKNNLKFTILILFLLSVTQTFSQIEDFYSWNELSVKKKVNKKITLILQQDIRLQNNASVFKDYVTVVGAQYSFNKKVKVRASYRYTYSNDLEYNIESEHRLYADLMLRHKINRFRLHYRARLQAKFVHFDVNCWYHLRNRFTIDYNIRKVPLVPYAEYEFYYSLNNPKYNSIDRSRYTLGLKYDVFDFMGVYTFYRILLRREQLRKPFNKYILGVGLSFKL